MKNHHFKVLLDDHYKLFQHVSRNKIPKPTKKINNATKWIPSNCLTHNYI